MKSALILFCSIVGIANLAMSQIEIKYEEVIKPSADAANLGVYGQYPVSYYRGLPQISIPLYQAKQGAISLDFNISYYASGIKVDQSSGFVGLGWVLNAGGVIVRNQGGNFDERNQTGYIKQGSSSTFSFNPVVWNQLTSQYSLNTDVYWDDYKDWRTGLDTEPDEFVFNFNGVTGKFVFDQNGQAITDSKLKINYTIVQPGEQAAGQRIERWEIIAENGVRYLFEQVERPWSISAGYGWRSPQGAITSTPTAWYLTKIISPDDQTIVEFLYVIETENLNEYVTEYTDTRSGYQNVVTDVHSPVVNLSEVKAPNFNIVLNTENTGDATSRRRLTNFRIQRKDGSEIKTLTFKYQAYTEYYELESGGQGIAGNRYQLSSLEESTNAGALKGKSHKFEYDPTRLPWRWPVPNVQRCGIDHWGYYNGEKPQFKSRIPLDQVGGPIPYNGILDRSANPTYSQAGVLKKIIYPTGGYTTFEYENNDYSYVNTNFIGQNKTAGGLRIKKIVSFDGLDASKNIIEKFIYEKQFLSGFSSGVIDNEPLYVFSFHQPTINISDFYRASVSFDQWFDRSYLPIEIGYSEVKVEHADGSYTIHNYTTSKDYPYQESADEKTFTSTSDPFTLAYRTYSHQLFKDVGRYDYMRGLLIQKSEYNSYGSLLVREENAYSAREISSHSKRNTFQNYSGNFIGLIRLKSVYNGKPELNSKYISTFNAEADPESTVPIITEQQDYQYNNLNYRVATKTSYISGGDVIVDTYKYPLDYGTISSSSAGNVKGLKILQDKNIISTPIEHYQIRKGTDNTNERVVSGELSLWNPSKPYADKFLKLNLQNSLPIASFTPSLVSGDNISGNTAYQAEITIEKYDAFGNPADVLKVNGNRESYLYGYEGTLLIASILNAKSAEVFCTSFEDSEGNSTILGDCKTGEKSRLTGYSKTVNGLPPNRSYKLTYFQKSGNNWIPQEQTLNTGSNTYLSITLSGQIDEIRLFPQDSQMTTYTYDPSIGVTCITDANNVTSYYQYDPLGRLITIRDERKNILKSFQYNYTH